MASVGLSTNVVVDSRPVTRQGLTGMTTQPLGPGRQIADDRYYMTELKTRISKISEEMENMKKEQVQIQQDNTTYQQYERKYEQTINQVRSLEGELADFNLALDKLRTNTDVADIREMSDRLRQINDGERKRVDSIFERAHEQQTQREQVEKEIGQYHNEIAEKMATLGEGTRQEYEDLQAELRHLNHEIEEKEGKIGDLDNNNEKLQQTLLSPEYRTHQRGLQLKKEKSSLLAKKMQLEEETDSSLTPQQIRDKLLQKVKDANEEIKTMERRLKTIEETTEKYTEEKAEKEAELDNFRKHSQKAKKYEAVYERDRKMQEFISNFPTALAEEQKNKTNFKTNVVALLRHISKGLHASENLPDAEQLKEMKSELSFKAQKLESSKDTLNMLSKDLERRKAELTKVNSLDKKITLELKSLKQKIESMTNEMANFKSEDELKEDATQAKKELLKTKQKTKKIRESLKQQVSLLGHEYEKKKRDLDGNETMKRIDGLEQKLRTYTQTVYQLQDYIQGRKRESDYESISKQVMETTAKCNRHIIDSVNSK